MLLDDYLTTREVAKELEMKPSAVTRAVQRGRLTGAVKKDWFWMVPKATVKALKAKKRRQSRIQGEVA